MSNAQAVDMEAGPVDTDADEYYAVFQSLPQIPEDNEESSGSEETTVEIRVAERIQIQSGPEPSYAIGNIPMENAGGDEGAMSVALNRSGIASRIKPNMRGTIVHVRGGSTVPILTGTVTDALHDLGKDGLVLTLLDDRWLLNKITVFGQIQFDPESGKSGFVATDPTIFNRFGYPDCIDAEIEKKDGSKQSIGPRFAPEPRYGWSANDVKPPERGKAKTRARYWYASDIVEYLRGAHYGRSNSLPPASATAYGKRLTPNNLIWPAGAGGIFRSQDEDGNIAERQVSNLVLQGMPLNLALERVARIAGPFHLFVAPGSAGGGDNGNDVEAGLASFGLDVGGIYGALQTAFENTMSTLQDAWDTGYEAFELAFNNALGVLQNAISNYASAMLSPTAEIVRYQTRSQESWKKMKDALDATDAGNFQEDAGAAWISFLGETGEFLTGDFGQFQPSGFTFLGSSAQVYTADFGNREEVREEDTLKGLIGGAINGRSTLGFISSIARGGGTPIYVPGISGDTLSDAVSGNGVQSGYYRESVINYFHEACLIGDPVVIERMFSMASSGLGANGLEKAWSDEDEQAFKDYISNGSQDRAAFLEATRLYPLVYAAYRVRSDFDFTEGTKWADKKGLQFRKHPRIRPALVTGINMSEANPRDWIPRQIIIEEERSTADWRPCQAYDGLALGLDGSYFMVPALRDHPTNHPTWSGDLANASGLTAENIRATLAVECDWPVTGWAGGTTDPNKTYRRIFNDGGSFQITTYVAVAAPMDYVEWLRHKDARPAGSQINLPEVMFPPRSTEGHPELFSDRPGKTGAPDKNGRIVQHALSRLRDVKRIEGTGSLVFRQFEPGMMPGAIVDGVLDFPLPRSVVQSVTIEANSQEMKVELG